MNRKEETFAVIRVRFLLGDGDEVEMLKDRQARVFWNRVRGLKDWSEV